MGFFEGENNCWIILLLLFCCCGGNGFWGGKGWGEGSWIWILILLCCCCRERVPECGLKSC